MSVVCFKFYFCLDFFFEKGLRGSTVQPWTKAQSHGKDTLKWNSRRKTFLIGPSKLPLMLEVLNLDGCCGF